MGRNMGIETGPESREGGREASVGEGRSHLGGDCARRLRMAYREQARSYALSLVNRGDAGSAMDFALPRLSYEVLRSAKTIVKVSAKRRTSALSSMPCSPSARCSAGKR